MRPFGAPVSGNLQPHPLHSYPLSATADGAKRGLPISAVSSAIALAGGSCVFILHAVPTGRTKLSHCVHLLARNTEEPVHTFGYVQPILLLAFDRLSFALSFERSGVFDV